MRTLYVLFSPQCECPSTSIVRRLYKWSALECILLYEEPQNVVVPVWDGIETISILKRPVTSAVWIILRRLLLSDGVVTPWG